MRIAALILAVLGGALALGLGIFWVVDVAQLEPESGVLIPVASDWEREIASFTRGAYVLIAAGAAALTASILVIKRRGRIAGVVLLAATIACIAFVRGFVWPTIGEALMLVAAVCAFFVVPGSRG